MIKLNHYLMTFMTEKKLKNSIVKAAFESFGYKSDKTYKWLRTQNEEIKNPVKKNSEVR